MFAVSKKEKLRKFARPCNPSLQAVSVMKECVEGRKEIWRCKYSVRGMNKNDLLYIYGNTVDRIFKRVLWMASQVDPSKDFEAPLMETMVYKEVFTKAWKSDYLACVTDEDVATVVTINSLLFERRDKLSKEFCSMVILGFRMSKSMAELKGVIEHVKGTENKPAKPWGIFYKTTDEEILSHVPTDMVLGILDGEPYKEGNDVHERLKVLSSTLRTVVMWLDCNGRMDRSRTVNEAEGIMCLYTNYVYASDDESRSKYEEATKHIKSCHPASVLFTLLCLTQSTDVIVSVRAEVLYPLYAVIRELVSRTDIGGDGIQGSRSVYNRFCALMTGSELVRCPVPQCISDSKNATELSSSVADSKSLVANSLIIVVFDGVIGEVDSKGASRIYSYVNEQIRPVVHTLPPGFHITLFNIVDNHIMHDVYMKKKEE